MKFDQMGKPAFISRRQSVHGHYPDRTNKLPHFQDIHLPEYANHIIPVELIHSGWTKGAVESHAGVSGLLNSLPAKAINDQSVRGPIRAVMLDVLHPNIPTYGEKLSYLKILENRIGKPDVLFAPDVKITKEDIAALLKSTKDEGREGIIVTDLHIPETINPRIKVKHYVTYNLRITGIQQEIDKNGNPKNQAGAVQVSDATGREVTTVGTGFSRDFKLDLWNNPKKYMHTLIQVKAFPSQAERLRGAVYNGEADGQIDTVPL